MISHCVKVLVLSKTWSWKSLIYISAGTKKPLTHSLSFGGIITTLLLLLQPFMALWILSVTTRMSWHQKGKTNLDLLEQKIVSGSGISWAICKSAPRPRHNHTSIFTGRMPFLPSNQQRQSTEHIGGIILYLHLIFPIYCIPQRPCLVVRCDKSFFGLPLGFTLRFVICGFFHQSIVILS